MSVYLAMLPAYSPSPVGREVRFLDRVRIYVLKAIRDTISLRKTSALLFLISQVPVKANPAPMNEPLISKKVLCLPPGILASFAQKKFVLLDLKYHFRMWVWGLADIRIPIRVVDSCYFKLCPCTWRYKKAHKENSFKNNKPFGP